MLDRIELSDMDLKGDTVARVLQECSEMMEFAPVKRIHLFPNQYEAVATAFRGAVRRAGRPQSIPWKDWNRWLMDEAMDVLPVTWHGAQIVELKRRKAA